MKDFYLIGIFLWPLANFVIAQTEFKYIKDFCQNPTDNNPQHYLYNDENSFIPRLEKRLHSNNFEEFNPDLFQMSQLYQKMKSKSSNFDISIDELFQLYHDESWILELFDHALDIVTMTCPDWLISHPFLKIIRQNFIPMCIQSHIETKNITKANLKLETEHSKGLTSSMWKVVNFETSRCKHRLNQTTDFKQIIENAYKIMGDEYRTFTPNYFKGNGKYSFQDRYDVILEFVWLIGQYVGAICHAIEENIYDFLPNFMRMYDKFYMKAMENQWKFSKPHHLQQDYRFLLGGFDYKIEYEKLGFCVTHAFEMTANLKPTEKFEEFISKPRLIRMHV